MVCAGALEPFNVYVWSLQTAKLLDVLSGHEGPVSSLSFNPTTAVLSSGSWDRTVKVWDVFNAGTSTETLKHEYVSPPRMRRRTLHRDLTPALCARAAPPPQLGRPGCSVPARRPRAVRVHP